jgi:hypothetical protein
MSRKTFFFLALAALSVFSAIALPAQPAKPHKNASATVRLTHRKTSLPAAHKAGRAAAHAVGHPSRRAVARTPRAAEAAVENSPAAAAEVPVRQATRSRRAARMRPVSLVKTRLSMQSPLKGSLDSLTRQNERTDAEGLERIEDEADLADRINNKLLVPVPASAALGVNSDLPQNHRYCRPWTAVFLADLALGHAAEFHRPLEVSSAVRTVEYQKRLMKTNGNAAAAEGDIVSPHLTGATIDIAKNGMSRQEIAWMRTRLLALQEAGKIDVEEEFKQSCFHITVYQAYASQAPALAASAPSSANQKGTKNE